MTPRYFIHSQGRFGDDTAFVKVCDEGYFCFRMVKQALIPLKCDVDMGNVIFAIEEYVKSGAWREVLIEELVLMFPL